MKFLEFKTHGYSTREILKVNPGVTRFGDLADGVAFEHDFDGWWVIAFSDLEKIYLAVKAERQK